MLVCERGSRELELGRCEIMARRSSGGRVVRWSFAGVAGGDVGLNVGGGVVGGVVRDVLVGDGEVE